MVIPNRGAGLDRVSRGEPQGQLQVALAALARQEIEAGRPLPEALARHQSVRA